MQTGKFPYSLYAMYFTSYVATAFYSTYLNLYLSGTGMAQSRIGIIVSVSTLFTLIAQMLWGVASDHAKNKTNVIRLLFAGCMAVSCMFYFSTNYWYLMFAVTLYACFFTGLNPLMDNVALELSEERGWDFGKIRAGGPLGYCIISAISGFLINNIYIRIFAITAAACFVSLLMTLRVPRVPGHRGSEEQKTPFKVVLKDKSLMMLIGFGVFYTIGMNFFYNYYPIYFTSLGGSSADIGIMMFFCAIMEIPSLMVAKRVITRFGADRVIVGAGLIASVRWFLLFLLKNPIAVVAVNLLHGVSYTGISYCIITYINQQVPKDLRATGQSLYVLLCSIVGRLLFGYIGGLASELIGANYVLLIVSLTLIATTAVFFLWSRRNRESYILR